MLLLPIKLNLLLFNALLTTRVLVKVNENKKWTLINLFLLSIYSWSVMIFVTNLSSIYIIFVVLSFMVPFIIILKLDVKSDDF